MSGNYSFPSGPTSSSTEMAIALNNFAITSLVDRTRNYHGAIEMIRTAVQYIKISLTYENSTPRVRNVAPVVASIEQQNGCDVNVSPIMVQVITNCSPCPTQAISKNGLLIIYPMVIDDSQDSYTGQRHKEEYLANVLMYNIAIINLLISFPSMKTTKTNVTFPIMVEEKQSDTIRESMEVFRAQDSFKIFDRTLSYMKHWVEPYLEYIFHEVNATENEPVLEEVPDNKLYRKYIILMLLISSQLMEIVQIMNLPGHYHACYSSMKNELQSVLTFIDLFVIPKMSSSETNDPILDFGGTISAAA